MTRHMVLGVAGMLLAACSLLPGADQMTLAGGPWTLTAIGDEATDTPRPATLQFNAQTGELTGSTGCNQLRGKYTVDEASTPIALTMDRITTTKMACLGAMAAERAVLDVLQDTRAYRIASGRLRLLSADGGVLAVYDAGAP